MGVCQFFLQGRCKFGDSCKNEHPGQASQGNRFAPLSNGGGNYGGGRARSGGLGGGDRYQPNERRDEKLPFHLDRDAIAADLTAGGPKGEKPAWMLSSYGPGREAPRQLLEGPLEQSPEEMRLLCYEARRNNVLQDYMNHEVSLKAQAQQQAQSILSDLDGAIRYVVDGEHQHPNRLDRLVIPELSTRPSTTTGGFGQPSGLGASTSAFGQPSQPASTSAFGQPSTFGQPRSAFGQPSQPAAGSGGFGQPSAMGGQRPAFGQAAQPAAQRTFGQPTQPAAPSTFGAPSQPGNTGRTFGAASGLGGQRPAFGQPSTQPAFGQSTFGQASQPAFGQASQPSGAPPFGAGQSQQQQSNTFGGQAANPSLFAAAAGAGSSFGQAGQSQPSQPSPFAAASGTSGQTSGFAAAGSQAGNNPFAPKPAGATFGAPSQPGSNVFGQPSQPQPPNGTFGQAVNGTTPAATTASPFLAAAQQPSTTNTGFGVPSASTAPAASTQTNGTSPNTSLPNVTSYSTHKPNSKALATWKGQPVNYDAQQTPPVPSYRNPQTAKQERIWHPDGPPERPNPYAEAAPEVYLSDIGPLLKEVYDYVKTNGDFKDVIPEIPPKREWVRWDL